MSDQGWGHPLRSKKAHYFVDGTSICGTVQYGGPLTMGHALPSDCRECAKTMRGHLRYSGDLGTLVTTGRSVTYTPRSEVRH